MYKSLSLTITLLMLVSCASLVTKPHEMPSPDVIFIHKNPKVGDFASYGEKNSTLGLSHHYEVYDVKADIITIRYQMRYSNPDYSDSAPKEWYYRNINHNGKVLRAWAKTDSGKVFTTPIAKAGSIGSIEHMIPIQKNTKQSIQVKAGKFKVDAINNYIYRTDVGLLSTNSTCLEFYSEEIPFKVIKREMLHTADVGALLTAADYMKTAGKFYLSHNYMDIYNQVTKRDISYQNTMELLEYGFAK